MSEILSSIPCVFTSHSSCLTQEPSSTTLSSLCVGSKLLQAHVFINEWLQSGSVHELQGALYWTTGSANTVPVRVQFGGPGW